MNMSIRPTEPRPAQPPPGAGTSNTAIVFDHVAAKLSGQTIIRDISLRIEPGEFVCVVGPSGSGKTTTLRLIAGLIEPSEGSVQFGGQKLTGPRSDIAVVFQDYAKALLPWRTAAENVSLALEARGVARALRRPIIMEMLQKVGLGEHAAKFPGEMSGGMQQRLQIARCLAQQPSVLLMDEPFGALDAMTRQSLQDELLALVRASGTTVFFVTHDLEEAIYLGNRVVGLRANPGRIGSIFQVDLPAIRDQLATRELPNFLSLRRQLFDFIKDAEREQAG
jgi:NitT/TauT family transport system ATP-binding protein